ncbi:hypothetical protein IFM47457_11314 [Aspergillus lentulus]|nr:hypothetical protein IFM47457_11314 [Aspergillus lentulus]
MTIASPAASTAEDVSQPDWPRRQVGEQRQATPTFARNIWKSRRLGIDSLYQKPQYQPWKGPSDEEKSGDPEADNQRGDGTRLNASRARLVKYSSAADQFESMKDRTNDRRRIQGLCDFISWDR